MIREVDIDRNLPVSSNLRLYNVLIDDDGNKFINFFRSYSVNESAKFNRFAYVDYQMEEIDWWDNISALNYETPYLWWSIALFNDIVNPFEQVEAGQLVKMLKKDLLYILFDDISEIEKL